MLLGNSTQKRYKKFITSDSFVVMGICNYLSVLNDSFMRVNGKRKTFDSNISFDSPLSLSIILGKSLSL
jgi:hypothetical protein